MSPLPLGSRDMPTPHDCYQMARAQIEHEDGLVGHRMTWFLTLQGFLFAAAFVGLGLFANRQNFGPVEQVCLVLILYFIAAYGIVSSYLCSRLISGAFDQMKDVRTWWDGTPYPKNAFPPLQGQHGVTVFGKRLNYIHFDLVVAGIWIVFVLLLSASVSFSSPVLAKSEAPRNCRPLPHNPDLLLVTLQTSGAVRHQRQGTALTTPGAPQSRSAAAALLPAGIAPTRSTTARRS